jgi:hypothetical protein
VGTIALIAGLVLGETGGYQLGAEMLNFGAFIAFMGVNLAAFTRYFVRAEKKSIGNFLMPLVGFVFCGYLFYGLSWKAKIAGGVWLGLGLIYGGIRTRGFQRELVTFDAPPEDAH